MACAVWFLGFATVQDGPLASVPTRTLASDRPFDDLPALLAPLGVDYAQGSALCAPLTLPAFEALCAAGSLEHATDAWRALRRDVASETLAVSARRQPVAVG